MIKILISFLSFTFLFAQADDMSVQDIIKAMDKKPGYDQQNGGSRTAGDPNH